ncbi:MAG: ParA family protein [Anaerolineae bacterium]
MILSVATQKGGVGKTTTAIALAAGLAWRGKRVLLIDLDWQANASKVLLQDYSKLTREETIYVTILKRRPLPVHPTSIPNLMLVPSHILLSDTDIELTTAKDHREARLSRGLAPIAGEYDHVIIDCPPILSWITINAFTASDKVLVPVAPGSFELDSTVQIGKTIEEVREYYHEGLRLAGFVFTMSDPTINSRTSLKILRQTYQDQVLRTVIPRNTDIRDAHFNKTDIFSFKPDAKAAIAYGRLIDELYYEEGTK